MTAPNDYYRKTEERLQECAKLYHPCTFRAWGPNRNVPFYETNLYDGYVSAAYFEATQRAKWSSEAYATWYSAMRHNPWGYFGDGEGLFFDHQVRLWSHDGSVVSSTYNLKANHHVSAYERLTGKQINGYERIVEWGAGAGDLAKFIKNLGFKGEYVIVDLPGTLLSSQANFAEWPRSYRPTFTTEPPPPNGKKTLFISTWALSETPIETRNKALKVIQPENWLLIYQRHIQKWGYNNTAYFKNWEGKREEIPWITWDGGSEIIAK